MTEAKDPTPKKPEKSQAKLFYRLDEVSRLANLDAGTIEGWEEEFSFLQAGQTGSGKKIFRQRDLEIILRIKELIDRQGFTLAGAKRKIEEEFGLQPASTSFHPDKLKKALWQVRTELQDISRTLEKRPKKV
ncbi:MAG: MerR family transcriptional regulator [Candidatus Aminicenantes bacterium]|nr:MerR family transcriptional regulator [Candidatus Aminicenantes bacterium]